MPRFARSEVEAAFAHNWETGCVKEDWATWSRLFTEDAVYLDHFWGPLHGVAQIRLWIDAVMAGVPEIYTVLDWYAIDDDVVTFHCQNRRDNPDPNAAALGEPDYWDFAGLSVLWYAGDGLWRGEEDFWDLRGARTTAAAYATTCSRVGADSTEARLTRRFWPTDGPAWARTSQQPQPSWLEQPDLVPLTRPSQLDALLAERLGVTR